MARMIAIWLRGLVKRRSGWLIGVVAGLALGVAILTDLGAFLASSAAGMTAKSIAALPIDWQIQLVNGADPATVLAAAGAAMPYDRHQTVLYADVDGFEAHSGGTVQTTGPGKAIGLALSYGQDFPGVMRPLLGVPSGVLLAQQTAANLHVGIGDR